MDMRYNLFPSDNKTRGEHMIVREILPDFRTPYRDRDFEPIYFIVLQEAESKLDELNKSIP